MEALCHGNATNNLPKPKCKPRISLASVLVTLSLVTSTVTVTIQSVKHGATLFIVNRTMKKGNAFHYCHGVVVAGRSKMRGWSATGSSSLEPGTSTNAPCCRLAGIVLLARPKRLPFIKPGCHNVVICSCLALAPALGITFFPCLHLSSLFSGHRLFPCSPNMES